MAVSDSVTEFLQRPLMATVATTNRDGSPQVSFVWYEWDGEAFKVSSRVNRQKVRNLRRDSRCAIAVIDPNDPRRWVIARGRAEVSEEGGRELIEALRVKYADQPHEKPSAEPRVLITLRPEKLRTARI
jgi:PPOX class probable F420-dependent enzyme